MVRTKTIAWLIAVVLLVPIGQAAPMEAASPDLPHLPADWHVTTAVLADITGDDAAEWVLLVWRPWRDWPIQDWLTVPSPIAGFHDASGDSCHLILIDPQDGHEIWAGSALPVPLLDLVVDDVDGDSTPELLTVEGSYARGRDGPGTHVSVWSWTGFGFTMEWRSSPATFVPSCLTDPDRCGISYISPSQGGPQ
jgi:hypothetical protein